jgi:hypothetical protein
VPGVSGTSGWHGPSVEDLLAGEESFEVEFKQTGVGQRAQSGKPQFPSDAVIKSVAAFLNSSSGGVLGIGISDDKKILGLEADFQLCGMDVDKYLNAVTSGLISACGAGPVTLHTKARPEKLDGHWIVLVDVSPSSKPVYTRTSKSDEVFFVRANNTTRQLGIAHVCNDRGGWGKGFVMAISQRWPQPEMEYRAGTGSGRSTTSRWARPSSSRSRSTSGWPT